MSDSKSFPATRLEALAMLWLKNQDLSGKSPAEVLIMYYEAYYAMKRDYDSNRAHYMEIKHPEIAKTD